jgi:4-amino-4-deoxy-L-arabinose transferase-like glycosyltransferase
MQKLKIQNSTFILILIVALALRLVVWQWREFYPLGGDEQEYLNTALTILRERRYEELLFMRPPLYPLFLAATIYVFDSLVQNLRLVQALISTATILFVYLLTREVAAQSDARHDNPKRPAGASLLAATLAALCYTLAANATELLSETLFLFGLTITLWLLLRAARIGGWRSAALAGAALGALCLVRSVALPLLPLGALWLLFQHSTLNIQHSTFKIQHSALAFVLATLLVLAPWTARNYVTYGGLILIDTTGTENLWLDNDPAGREAVKAQLFALGDDRLARQRLASQEGSAAILADPQRFAAKAWSELKKLFALEYTDDMRNRPAIWLPPTEVWARLALGDGLWLLILLMGSYGLTQSLFVKPLPDNGTLLSVVGRPSSLLALFALYIVTTSMIFHVELRYRLPLYPVLLPYTGLILMRLFGRDGVGNTIAAGNTRTGKAPSLPGGNTGAGNTIAAGNSRTGQAPALLASVILVVLTLLHANYPTLAWQLAQKHGALTAAERAVLRGDARAAESAARAALANDERSALARVALARAALLRGDAAAAEALLREAINVIPAHPHAHLLLGDLLRQQGTIAEAASELRYETGSLENLQAWAWERFTTPLSSTIEVGDGLDLGMLRGFHAVGQAESGFRWSFAQARLRLAASQTDTQLVLRLASGRPDGSAVSAQVFINGQSAGEVQVASEWQDYRLPLPTTNSATIVVELRSPTFTPRDFDPASPDGRELGLMVDRVRVEF